jgi:mRNA interferase HigB
VRVISRHTLKNFCESCKGQKDYKALKGALDSWYAEAKKASWKNSSDVKLSFSTASIISSDRVVFNIKGNDYRLVVSVHYRRQIVFIKWIGTHKEYDKINAKEVSYGNQANKNTSRS